MQVSFGVHHNSQVALDLITDIWFPMFLKNKKIIVARSEVTGVLSFTHFQIATKLARSFKNKYRYTPLY
jgi:Leu/Phe-tRNA-protein transferase